MDELLLFFDGLMKLALVVAIMVFVATAPSAKPAPFAHRLRSGHDESRRQSFDDDLDTCWSDGGFEPAVNIDGTPMCGDVDIRGNPFGVTDWSSDHRMHSCDSDWMGSDHYTTEWSSDDGGHSASNDDWQSSTDFGCSSSSLFD